MTEKQIKKEAARLKRENPDLSEEQIAEMIAELALKEGTAVEYVCHTRCTFEGAYYKEGDILVTDAKDVPEYFSEKE